MSDSRNGQPLNISMQWLTIECHVCGCVWHCAEGGSYGIPLWSGLIVGNDWPHDWMGAPVCEPCYRRHERGELTEIEADEIRKCRVCGCTDERACVIDDGIPCHWVADDLCSVCEGER